METEWVLAYGLGKSLRFTLFYSMLYDRSTAYLDVVEHGLSVWLLQGSSGAAEDARIITYPQTSPVDVPKSASQSSLFRRGPPPSFVSSGRAASASTQPDGRTVTLASMG